MHLPTVLFIAEADFPRAPRTMGMRLAVFAILAFVASGCTIHVVEQPAAPVGMAAAPVYEPQLRPRRVAYEPAPVAAPTPPRPRAPTARPARSKVVPFKTLTPEPRHTRLAAVAPATRRRPQKVKRPEPPARVTLASVAKTQ